MLCEIHTHEVLMETHTHLRLICVSMLSVCEDFLPQQFDLSFFFLCRGTQRLTLRLQ